MASNRKGWRSYHRLGSDTMAQVNFSGPIHHSLPPKVLEVLPFLDREIGGSRAPWYSGRYFLYKALRIFLVHSLSFC